MCCRGGRWLTYRCSASLDIRARKPMTGVQEQNVNDRGATGCDFFFDSGGLTPPLDLKCNFCCCCFNVCEPPPTPRTVPLRLAVKQTIQGSVYTLQSWYTLTQHQVGIPCIDNLVSLALVICGPCALISEMNLQAVNRSAVAQRLKEVVVRGLAVVFLRPNFQEIGYSVGCKRSIS